MSKRVLQLITDGRVWDALVQRAREVIADVVLGQVRTMRKQCGDATHGMRITIAALVLSAAGFGAIVTREGWCGKACVDPVKGAAVPTLGFGTTGPDVKMGDTITPVAGVNRALRDVQAKEAVIKRCAAGVELHQYEYDAYIELTYNIGEGAFCRSSIVKSLKARDYRAACDHILDWKYVGDVDCSKPNKVCAGLWTDRLRMHAKCVGTQ